MSERDEVERREKRVKFTPVILHLWHLDKELFFANQDTAESFLDYLENQLSLADERLVRLEEGDDFDITEIDVFHDAWAAFQKIFLKRGLNSVEEALRQYDPRMRDYNDDDDSGYGDYDQGWASPPPEIEESFKVTNETKVTFNV